MAVWETMMPFFGRVETQRPELNDFWRFLERLHKETEKKKHGVKKLKQVSKVDVLSKEGYCDNCISIVARVPARDMHG